MMKVEGTSAIKEETYFTVIEGGLSDETRSISETVFAIMRILFRAILIACWGAGLMAGGMIGLVSVAVGIIVLLVSCFI